MAATGLPAVRAFGSRAADLDLDLAGHDRPALVTVLLAHCCVENDLTRAAREERAWNLAVGARILRLLQIVEHTIEGEAFTLELSCPRRACGQSFEVTLPFARIEQAAPPARDVSADGPTVTLFLPHGRNVALRLPTGRDQAAWRGQRYANPEATLAAIVRSLSADPSVIPASCTDEELAPLNDAMAAADPLVAFTVDTTCPHCEHEAEVAVDLELCALRRLAEHRRALLRDIHRFATRYGWSEAQVLAIPAGRRAEYKRIMAAEEKTVS